MAVARGVPVRLVGVVYMLALAVSVGLSALTIGAILSTALLIGPAAAALRLTTRMGWALGLARVTGVLATWLGVLLAYDSYYWGSSHARPAGELLHRRRHLRHLPGLRAATCQSPCQEHRNGRAGHHRAAREAACMTRTPARRKAGACSRAS